MNVAVDATPPDLERYRVGSAARGNAAAATTHALREAILDGVLTAGTWLREVSLSAALGVSRTPLREALARLEDEGLVVRESGAGARVTSMSIDDMSVIYQVRGSLESLAARFAATRVGANELATLRRLQEEMYGAHAERDPVAFAHANVLFHRRLADSAGNAYLTRLLGPVEVALRRFGGQSLTEERMSQVLHEHDAILRAFAEEDADAAAAAAALHAENARSSTLARMIQGLR